MIRTLLTTTALAALLTAGAVAQDAAPMTDATTIQPFDLTTGYQAVDTDDLATRIIGAPIYTSAANDAEHIGDINDLVLDQSGDIRAVIVGVGGFLGVGEKNVAVDFSALTMVTAEDNTERWVLEGATQEALNAAPVFEFIEDSPDAATDTAVVTPADPAMTPVDPNAPATDTAAVPANDAMGVDTAIENENEATAIAQPGDAVIVDRSTMTVVETALTAEELIGTRVVGPDQQQIAEVGDLVLTEDGQVDAVLVDFGGFLGIGEKRVAVGMDNLEFLVDANGNRYVFLQNITREQLEAAPAYDQATYATDRDAQRLTLSAM